MLGALVLLFTHAGLASADPTLPNGFTDTPVITGVPEATVVRFASDGRVFVAEKSGVILVFDSLADTTPEVFADLSKDVDDYWDRGLLGLALDPDFPTKPYVYALYSLDAPIGGTAPVYGDACADPTGVGCTIGARLVRMTAAGDHISGDPVTLIESWCQQFPSHSIGQLQFGPDGALYVTAGEGGSFVHTDWGQYGGNTCGDPPAEGGALRAQSPRRPAGDPVLLNGALLRLDPATGLAAPGNPGTGSENAQRIVAYGLRNPFRFTFRPGTSEVWIGDVGWDTWEEIDRVADPTAGVENLGWPCYEGDGAQPAYAAANLSMCATLSAGAVTGPYYAYQHNQPLSPGDTCDPGTAGSSISGMAFYDGGNYPADYSGALFFADYSRNCIWVMRRAADGLPDPASVQSFVTGANAPVELETGPGGDLFYANLTGGTIDRISYTLAPGDTAPTARATATPPHGESPLTVQFDGAGSSDPDPDDPLTYAWTFGDGDTATGVDPAPHVYAADGQYRVALQVTDSHGLGNTTHLTVTAGKPPSAHIDAPDASLTYEVGDTIHFSGEATDPVDGMIPDAGLEWTLLIHHCPTDASACHIHHVEDLAGASGSFRAPDHGYPSYLELQLTATNSRGLTDTASVSLHPRAVELTFRSQPTGLRLALDSSVRVTPFTSTVIVNSENSVSAVTPQTLAGIAYDFRSWSDGGAQSHTIIAPAHATTYTATLAKQVAAVKPRPAGADVRPLITHLAVMHRVARLGPAASRHTGSVHLGTAFVYRLSERAAVTIAVRRAVRGYARGGSCLLHRHGLRHPRRCTLDVTVGTQHVAGEAGANTTALKARMHGRTLRPGRYRAVAQARDAAGQRSPTRTVSFEIVA